MSSLLSTLRLMVPSGPTAVTTPITSTGACTDTAVSQEHMEPKQTTTHHSTVQHSAHALQTLLQQPLAPAWSQ